MRRLMTNELVKGLLVGAQENGFAGLRRYSTDTRHDAAGPVPKFSPGFVLFRSKAIGITDAYFQTAEVSDSLSGYRFGDLILTHELIHAFDDRKKSTDIGFTSLTAWVFRNNRWDYLNPVSFSEYNGVLADTMTLYGRGRYGEAWARDRSFATAMTFPLPTIQSLATPGESVRGHSGALDSRPPRTHLSEARRRGVVREERVSCLEGQSPAICSGGLRHLLTAAGLCAHQPAPSTNLFRAAELTATRQSVYADVSALSSAPVRLQAIASGADAASRRPDESTFVFEARGGVEHRRHSFHRAHRAHRVCSGARCPSWSHCRVRPLVSYTRTRRPACRCCCCRKGSST